MSDGIYSYINNENACRRFEGCTLFEQKMEDARKILGEAKGTAEAL